MVTGATTNIDFCASVGFSLAVTTRRLDAISSLTPPNIVTETYYTIMLATPASPYASPFLPPRPSPLSPRSANIYSIFPPPCTENPDLFSKPQNPTAYSQRP